MLYLNLIWHQHQPLYLDPALDQLQAPWVRTHATKDYYDMTAIIQKYPSLHYTVNFSSSLLLQLQKYYVERLQPFVDTKKNTVDTKKFFAQWEGKTDPWIDIALKSQFTERDKEFLLYKAWNAFSTAEIQMARFPEYQELKKRNLKKENFTEEELRKIIFYFYLVHFDPDFLHQPITLIDGSVVDITDLVIQKQDGKYELLPKHITEKHCNRIIAETYKICANIIPLHKKLFYNHKTHRGQVEIITTPFYHPILPLLYNSDEAKICQPHDPMPHQFFYPQDAHAQVAMASNYYKKIFGKYPIGMWPAEGSVSHDVVKIFTENNIEWIATDEKILHRSTPHNSKKIYPYKIEEKNLAIVFRDTEFSDKIGFTYQHYEGKNAAEDFIENLRKYIPQQENEERLLTVILDGENAWEHYKYDNDGKEFLHHLYTQLSELHETGEIRTVTMSEYIYGNPKRKISAHPISSMKKLDWLYPGSWINANFDTWIGEREENSAWNYLLIARQDLENSGIPSPNPKHLKPIPNTKKWYAYKTWESMYAAEGSDWFWWYGTDQQGPSGDTPFDEAFITYLNNIYKFGKLAGGKFPEREFQPIAKNSVMRQHHSQGTMAQSRKDRVKVVFQCDTKNVYVRKGIFIVGNHQQLGNWIPNNVKMYDDGTGGDITANDGVWSIELEFPHGITLEYKYTNSGPNEEWQPGEEFPAVHRTLVLDGKKDFIVVKDVFGEM